MARIRATPEAEYPRLHMGGGWRIGRIGGVEIRADASILFIVFLIVASRWVEFANLAPLRRPSPPVAGLLAFGAAALFVGSVLVHELGHAAVARWRHIPVEGITLWMFGGATQTKSDAKGPGDEFMIAAVGPATSFALGWILLAIGNAMPTGAGQLLIRDLGSLNILLAIFNVLPGFPMDGGRVLRSLVWAVTRSQSVATLVAAHVGQVFGAGVIAYGAIRAGQRGDFAGYAWLIFIGLMLYQAATATVRQERRNRKLSSVTAGDVMRPPPATVPADRPIGEVRGTILDGREGAFPVMDGGHLVGFVSRTMLEGMAPERPVREVATSRDAAVLVTPREPLGDVVARMNETAGGLALVVDGDQLVGVIGPEDVSTAAAGRR